MLLERLRHLPLNAGELSMRMRISIETKGFKLGDSRKVSVLKRQSVSLDSELAFFSSCILPCIVLPFF